MGGDDDLELPAPHLFRQFHADLMAPLRGDFAGFEALVAVPSDIPACLLVLLFR